MNKKLSILFLSITTCLYTTSLSAQPPFKRMDSNNDGLISRSEFAGPPMAFGRMDLNNDGYITRREAAGSQLLGKKKSVGKYPNRPTNSSDKNLLYVDGHNHLVGRRAMGQHNFDTQAQICLESMNSSGIKYCLLMPMPQTVDQKSKLVFEDLQPIIKKYPNRFKALGGGGSLNVMIQQAILDGQVTTAMVKKFDARVIELINQGVVGFGEMTTEHFSMSNHHPYITAPPDHPLFLRLADLAAEHDLPIDIHMEAIPEKMTLPPRLQSPPNPQVLQPNIASFSRLLAHNRKAKIIWDHLGWDNTSKRDVKLTRRLLAEHPNLYISIRIAAGMKRRRISNPTFPLDGNGRLKQEWLQLFQEYPDRFLIGSDEIVRPDNNHPSAGSIRATVSLLDQLPEKLRSQIGYENGYQLFKFKRK